MAFQMTPIPAGNIKILDNSSGSTAVLYDIWCGEWHECEMRMNQSSQDDHDEPEIAPLMAFKRMLL